MVGHSYIVYAPLICGATTVLYEGKPVGTPDAGAFWRVVAEHGVQALFTAPTAIRAIKKEDPDGALLAEHDLSRCAPVPGRRAARPRHLPLGDETARHPGGRPLVADRDRLADRGQPRGLEPMPIKAGLADGAGARLRRARSSTSAGRPAPAGTEGAICIRLPLPPGTLPTLWGDDERYVASYLSAFDGYYLTGDGGYLDEDGYLFVMGRTDDVINVAGHRLSTGAIEAVLAAPPGGRRVRRDRRRRRAQGPGAARVRRAQGRRRRAPTTVARELVALVRDEIGAVAAFKDVDGRRRPAEDPVGQDPAQDDARDRRERRRAPHHRGGGRGRRGAPRAAPGAGWRPAQGGGGGGGGGVARVLGLAPGAVGGTPAGGGGGPGPVQPGATRGSPGPSCRRPP